MIIEQLVERDYGLRNLYRERENFQVRLVSNWLPSLAFRENPHSRQIAQSELSHMLVTYGLSTDGADIHRSCTKSGRFNDGCELIKALARFSHTGNELHIELYCTERPGTCRGASGGLGPGRYFFCETDPT
jgi:hypothetical protein